MTRRLKESRRAMYNLNHKQQLIRKPEWGNDSLGCGTVENPHGALEMFIHASDNAPTTEMIMTVPEIVRVVMKNIQLNEPVRI